MVSRKYLGHNPRLRDRSSGFWSHLSLSDNPGHLALLTSASLSTNSLETMHVHGSWSSGLGLYPVPEGSQADLPLPATHTHPLMSGLSGLALTSPSLGSLLLGFYIPAPP